MKTRLLLVPLLVAVVAALAACGGGGAPKVPNDAVAVVGSQPITISEFNSLMAEASAQAKAQKQPVPKIGTPQYTQLRDHVISYLVQISEIEQEAAKHGVKVTDGDVNAYIQSIQKLHYGGSAKKLKAALKGSGMTMAQARFQVKVNLIAQKLKTKITSAVKVSTADEQKYYDQNKAAYHQNKSRQVEHILVGSKKQAEMIEQKLQAGQSFASLAKKYSKDTGTASQGGKYTAVEGQDVPQFDKAAFSLKTGATSAPVHSQFGWHVIRALGPVKAPHTETFKQVQATIQQNLLAQAQQTAWGNFLQDLPKKYQGKIAYQTGYAPATTATSTIPTTT